uniref:Motility protein n=1 Tax=Ascaris lumbricoides TaxID=6252 RepID=A0A0M3HLA5_ASCLU
MSANDVATNPQPNGTISPRPPIPVDPAPQSESLIERTIRLVEQNSLTAQQLNELQQQALLSLRQSVDSSSALQAAQISTAATAGQQSHDGLHTQQVSRLEASFEIMLTASTSGPELHGSIIF